MHLREERSCEERTPEEKEGLKVLIIMYHSVLNARNGKYIISPAELENDLKYLKDNGYHTITMGDLIAYVYDGKELPEKPVVLTFDDGCYNNYFYAFPMLSEYGMKAVISIVGEYTDKYTASNIVNVNYSNLRWVDINMLMSSRSYRVSKPFLRYAYHQKQKWCQKENV